ncbi:MAG TPA: hypothetical protein VJ846_12465 [Sphingomicrobium sp.]|nr:hypothetical protein [Sphingomicrobium sp.]
MNYPTRLGVRKFGIWILLAAAVTSINARGTVVFAGGAWAAIDRETGCEAISRSQRVAPKDKVQGIAGIGFTSDHRHWGEFHARLSRIPRDDSSVILKIAGQPFLLVSLHGWAWSRGPLQAQAIIAAIRNATAMSIESRDAGGVHFSDPYLLDGAPTAIDAAAARCALRGAGKIH